MAASLPMSSLIFLFLLSFSSVIILSQQDPSPTMAQCATRLLPLAPCSPFVQGSMQLPSQICCDNLKQLFTQQPQCLCLVLNDTSLSSLPLNTSLALQLPLLCSLQVDVFVCSAGINGSTSPGSQVSLGSNDTNSRTAVNSTADSTSTGLGFPKSGGINWKTSSDFAVVLVAAIITYLLTEVIL